MLGDENGKVPDTVRALKNGEPKTSIVNSDDFENSKLGLHWQWTKIGSDYKLTFDWRRFFMGSMFTLFCYATKKAGGYADFDYFTFK